MFHMVIFLLICHIVYNCILFIVNAKCLLIRDFWLLLNMHTSMLNLVESLYSKGQQQYTLPYGEKP